MFIQCPRCFYIDRRLGLGRPPGFPFSLNSAVDKLLKTEFDTCRVSKVQHPIQAGYGIPHLPAINDELENWRENFKGVQVNHKATNLLVFGAIDDLWIDDIGNHAIVDYKATSKKDRILELDQPWHDGYKRQMEIYQWLVRRNGLSVSDVGYFVYCNGNAQLSEFDNRLEFETTLIPYEGDDSWVEPAIVAAHACLNSNSVPSASNDCDYCLYASTLTEVVADGALRIENDPSTPVSNSTARSN